MDSVALYVHIPFCRQKCDYCDFYSVAECNRRGKVNDLSDDYISAVLNEVRCYVNLYDIKQYKTVYIGGGTPSLLSTAQLKNLVTGILNSVPCKNENIEFTVEVNPENVSEDFLKTAQESGVTRISMGIQSFNDKVLNLVHRGCSGKQVENALKLISLCWKGKFSVDLIAGLPGSTYRSFAGDIERACSCGADHISLYTLTVTENTPLAMNIDEGKIKWNPEKADKMWLSGRKILEEKGFCQYEVSNFCRPGFESIHNSTYWKLQDYLGCGAGASGTLYGKKIRWTDTLSIPEYERFFNCVTINKIDEEKFPRLVEKLDDETLKFEFVMMGMRMVNGICREEYIERFGEDFSEKFKTVFEKWHKNKLAAIYVKGDKSFYTLGKKGILFLNAFLEEIL